jgi:hypothetical protein
VQRWKICGLAGLLAAAAGTAGAQGVPGTADAKPLVLLCTGSDTTVALTEARYGGTYGVGTGYGVRRIPAQLGVMVEKGEVKVRPPPSSQPIFNKKSGVDGWYRLEKSEVTEFLIRGRSPSGRILNDKLDVDRRTGAATFADFVGTCRVAPTNAAGTQF